ncbi:MAG TPA: FHA domain-containing protein [Kofleriaceae bacterium]|nr:FHA domain-containing protein [Kofleriaceae bacterium]
MARSTVHCLLVDLRDLREEMFELAELHAFYSPGGVRREVTVGRDPACDIVIDHPAVEPRHAWLTAASNHRMVRLAGAEMRERHDGRPFAIGPYGMQLWESEGKHEPAPGPPHLPIRINIPTARRVTASSDDSALDREARRLFHVLVDPASHMRELDEPWCQAQLRAHFASLGLTAGRIEYTSSLAYARERWKAEWFAVEHQPFTPAAWRYVHRLAAWRAAQASPHFNSWFFTAGLQRAWPDVDLAETLEALLEAHLASLPDDGSPARPLVALAERGVIPFALPGDATLLYLLAGRDIARCSARDEEPLLRALAEDPTDHATRLVYADLLEGRGELARAEHLRAEAAGQNFERRVARVEHLFHHARAVFLPRPHERVEMWPVIATADPPPAARLEGAQRTYPLAALTGVAVDDQGAVTVVDLRATPDFQRHATLTYADGTFWLRMHDYHTAWVNDAHCGSDHERPLLEGDTIQLGWQQSKLVLRLA